MCPKYPSIIGISILMDRWTRIHCRTKVTNAEVTLTTLNTRIRVSSCRTKVTNAEVTLTTLNTRIRVSSRLSSP